MYDPSIEDKISDTFGPLSDLDCLKLPSGFEISFIADPSDLDKLDSLLKEKFIGIDTEWKPAPKGVQPRLALLQLSGARQAFLIDMIKLGDSKQFDKKMT
jgi:hypothetical protein